jgi:hypothetical protein
MKLGVWFMPVIPTFHRLRKKDHRFEANLGYIVSPCPDIPTHHPHRKKRE